MKHKFLVTINSTLFRLTNYLAAANLVSYLVLLLVTHVFQTAPSVLTLFALGLGASALLWALHRRFDLGSKILLGLALQGLVLAQSVGGEHPAHLVWLMLVAWTVLLPYADLRVFIPSLVTGLSCATLFRDRITDGQDYYELLAAGGALSVVSALLHWQYTSRTNLIGELRYIAHAAARSNSSIALLDPVGRINWHNEACNRVLGTLLELHPEASWLELMRLAGAEPKSLEPFALALQEHHSVDGEVCFLLEQGSQAWAHVAITTQLNDSGEFEGFFVMGTDRTQLHEAEEVIRSDEELRNRILNLSHDCIMILDLEGMILEINRSGRELLEIEDMELFFGADIRWLWTGEDLQKACQSISRAVTGEVGQFTGYCPTVTGKPMWWDVAVSPTLGSDGNPTRLLAIARDITRLVEDHEELTKAVSEAVEARQVAELRSYALQEQTAQLEEARDTALTAMRAKADFLANVSHEIRTPMNGIIGMADLMIDGDLPAEQLDLAHTLRDSALALLSLVNDILDFSKIEAGRMTLEDIPFEPVALVEEAAELFSARSYEKGIEISTQFSDDLPSMAQGDPSRVRQVLLNLVGNAVKFTVTGEITLKVGLIMRGDQPWIQYSVSDTGPGIPLERQRAVFEAFTQADASTTRRYGGTGLGLAIGNQLAKLMGGQLRLKSTEGVGSTFLLELPLPVGEELRAAVPEPRSETILVISPSDAVRASVVSRLRRVGYTVQAEPEIAALTHSSADIVVVDSTALSKHLPSSGHPKQRVLALVHPADRVGKEFLQTQGVHAILSKPVRSRPLLHSLLETQAAPAVSVKSVDLENSLEGIHVLVVEDNPVNQKVVVRILGQFGAKTTTALNGRDAIRAFSEAKFDMILMDCQMPEMDGYEATRIIRELEETEGLTSIPIIALTANVQERDRRECLACGMNGFLGKPFRPVELLNELTRFTQVHEDAA